MAHGWRTIWKVEKMEIMEEETKYFAVPQDLIEKYPNAYVIQSYEYEKEYYLVNPTTTEYSDDDLCIVEKHGYTFYVQPSKMKDCKVIGRCVWMCKYL